jgi:hypothetical protein
LVSRAAMKAREPKPDISTALTVEQFHKIFCLTSELYAALKRCRLAPRELRNGERKLITLQDAAHWCCEVEGLRTFAQRWLSR